MKMTSLSISELELKYWGFLNSGFSTWNATQSMHSIYLELYTLPCRSWGLVKWHKLCDSGTIAIALNNKLSFVSNPGVYFVFSVSNPCLHFIICDCVCEDDERGMVIVNNS